MNIYAFYEPIDEFGDIRNDYEKIIKIWKKSWSYYGWNPIILGMDDSKKHIDYEEFNYKIKQFPSIYPEPYNTLCYVRWLAIANIGGWYADVDMINYGFTPFDNGTSIIGCFPYYILCPSTIYMTKNDYNEKLITFIKNYKVDDDDKIFVNGEFRRHVSDMSIINKFATTVKYEMMDIQANYKEDNRWENSKIVHYTTVCMNIDENDRNKSRYQIILENPRNKMFL